jgi:cell division protein FtsI/penicillin-binding protein 2
LDLLDTAKNMGLGQKTGIDLPYEAKGQLPRDIQSNKTGLYAFAIGQHELLVTPLQTAQMMASLFQNGKIYKPQIVSHIYEKTQTAQDIFHRLDEDVYNEALSHLGCFFPLFTENLKHEETVTKAQVGPQVLNQYEMHPDILTPIKKGLDRVVWGEKGTARPLAIASMIGQKEMQNYLNLKHQMIGKTGTAEQSVIETLDQDAETRMLNHIWFSCISFEDSSQKDPELAICIYLKDGKLGGKEAAPIAAKIIEFYKKQKNTHL